MTIKNQAPSELFNRLIKSILTLQKIHKYDLCKDFEDGVRVISDALLDREMVKFDAIQRAQRPPLNICMKRTWLDSLYPYRNWALSIFTINLFILIFYLGVISAPFFAEPTAVPIITVEEFNEMATKCPN
jgi:hypothetical protein